MTLLLKQHLNLNSMHFKIWSCFGVFLCLLRYRVEVVMHCTFAVAKIGTFKRRPRDRVNECLLKALSLVLFTRCDLTAQ